MPKTKKSKPGKTTGSFRSRTSAASKHGAQKSRRIKSAPAKAARSAGSRKAASSKSSVTRKPAPRTSAKAAKAVKTTASVKSRTVATRPVGSKLRGKAMAGRRNKPVAKASSRKSSKSARQVLPIVKPLPPPPEPPRRQVASGVVRAFEHAVRVFNRRNFAEARSLFEGLLSRYPDEVEVAARVHTYLQVCNQKLSHKQSSPRDADELYDRGVFALNVGDFTQARSLFEKALRLKPNEPHVLYSLAATHAQSGTHDQALDYLTRSIQMQPRFRFQALNDSDFSGLREDKRFLELTGVSSPFDLLDSRR
jgi:predicted Zn-dependent protease